MQCYVINLDRSPDRLASMRREFAKFGLSFTRVPAIDGRKIDPQQISQLTPSTPLWDYPLTAAEIGCFLSHRDCLERIANGEDGFAAVFEDDVLLSDDAKPFLENSDWVPAGTDIVKLETHGREVLLDKIVSTGVGKPKIAELLSSHLCTGGYIISREAALRLLPKMSVAALPIDSLYFDPAYDTARTLNLKQLVPAICVQSGFDSTITSERSKLRPPKKRRPLALKLLREISRPIWKPIERSRYSLAPQKLWLTLTTSKKWCRVPFE